MYASLRKYNKFPYPVIRYIHVAYEMYWGIE